MMLRTFFSNPFTIIHLNLRLLEFFQDFIPKNILIFLKRSVNILYTNVSGAAGQVCAETLRQEGFSGRLVMICAEKYSPYERIKLSKQLDLDFDKIQLRPDTFYKVSIIMFSR